MGEDTQTRPREYETERLRLQIEIHGLISASRCNPIVHRVWDATGNIREIRELLEIQVQTHPEVRRILERLIEIEGNLVTASGIIRPFKEV